MIEEELGRGDCLYIPRGFPHAATTQERASAHLTVGILSYTWADLLRDVAGMAETEPEFSEPLPIRFADDPELMHREAEDRLRSFAVWLEKQDAAEVVERMSRRFFTGRRPMLTGQLQQLEALDALGDSTRVRRRPGAMCVLGPAGEELSVLIGDRELTMPGWIQPAVELLTKGTEVAVGALHPYLDEESRKVLVRRLVREGLLEVVA
jgi:hypothetical protein